MLPTQDDSSKAEFVSPPNPSVPLWRNRDYLLLWSGQTISNMGSKVSGFAFPLMVLFLTKSASQAGLVVALNSLPYLFLSLPVGALVDRWDRKRVMVLCDAGRALALGSIPVTYAIGHLTIVQIYLVALVEGTLFVFFNLAEVACLPQVVSKEQLPRAAGQNRVTEGTSSLIGPPLGGILYSASLLLPFLADAISYVVSVGSLILIRTAFQRERRAVQRKLRVEVAEGLSWLWHQPLIRFMACVTGGLNFIFAGGPLILIVLAQQQGASPPFIGLVFTIGAIGGILGSVVGPAIQKRFSFSSLVISTLWINALFWPLYIIAPNPLLLGAVNAVIAFVTPIYDVVQFSYRLALIPDALQGRVNSVFRLLAFGLQPLGGALAGVFLQRLGAFTTVLIFGICFIVVAAAATINPYVRHAAT